MVSEEPTHTREDVYDVLVEIKSGDVDIGWPYWDEYLDAAMYYVMEESE